MRTLLSLWASLLALTFLYGCGEPTCSNGILEGDEECDDNNNTNGDGCTAACVTEVCGDNIDNNNNAEECDGADLGGLDCIDQGFDSGTLGCASDCSFDTTGCATCGDGNVEADEACDDGNLQSNDGCSNVCAIEVGFTCAGNPSACTPICGDGFVLGTEECDDANQSNEDGCTNECRVAFCGDGFLQAGNGEACDDGNNSSGDGCRADCQKSEVCGDGTTDANEECDDLNTTSNDGCDAACLLEFCGDGVQQTSEQCDDGNTLSGDGCDALCATESCGDNAINTNENCEDGNTTAGDGCSDLCQIEAGHFFEQEPNDDGVHATNGTLNGNDFSAANANGPLSSDVIIHGTLNPLGDEDVFAISNPTSVALVMRFDVFNSQLGMDVSCGTTTIDPVLNIRSAAGTLLLQNDDRGNIDFCPGGSFTIPANTTVFIHLVEREDNEVINFGVGESIQGYLLRVKITPCGNGTLDANESCDDGNQTTGDGCTSDCQDEICGDGVLVATEECDDGNTNSADGCSDLCALEGCGEPFLKAGETCGDANKIAGDGCSELCQTEAGHFFETEPNDDNNLEVGGSANDFSSVNANGPIADNLVIHGALNPAGDEDVFAIHNPNAFAASVRFDVFNAQLGLGVSCGTNTINPVLNIRNSSGSTFSGGQNNDRSGTDLCPGLTFTIPANGTVFAHITDSGDNSTIHFGTGASSLGYLLQVSLPVCGNGLTETGEVCDDGNQDNSDACLDGPNELCQPATCGDGVIHIGQEECDDANDENNDACLNSCQIAICGDGVILEGTEECDDGNNTSGDECDAACQFENICGNNLIEFGEDCEDGNITSGDGCSAECATEDGFVCDISTLPGACSTVCGDSFVRLAEQCEDGNTISGDGCSSACQFEAGHFFETEPNDDGSIGIGTNDFDSVNADIPPLGFVTIHGKIDPAGDEDVFAIQNTSQIQQIVTLDLFSAQLGPGVSCGTNFDFDPLLALHRPNGSITENDDKENNDFCPKIFAFIPPNTTFFVRVKDRLDNTALNFGANDEIFGYLLEVKISSCGNSQVEPPEICDDGNETPGDGCNEFCEPERCGDGLINNSTETCDDGAFVNGDGCNSSCQLEVCGDGVINNGGFEDCDDGGAIDGDGCDASCNAELCGDGLINNAGLEECDDQNNVDGDGCSATCFIELCGDGLVNNNEECDDGNQTNNDGCDALCSLETDCGNGIIEGVEVCDDGNPNNLDGCSSFCRTEVGFTCTGAPSICASACGDGAKTSAEGCDDGNLTPGDGCSALCVVELGFDCSGSPSNCDGICGDGLVFGAEDCDDGGVIDGDGCSSSCTDEVGCQPGEIPLIIASTDVPKAIPEQPQVSGPLNIASSVIVVNRPNTVVTRLVVTIANLMHPSDRDVRASLRGPGGALVLLIDFVGETGDNFINTTLDDTAAIPLSAGAAPFAGTFRPDEPLSEFVGQSANGTFSLEMSDLIDGNVGTLNAWSLSLCFSQCGDGLITAFEECDDGNLINEDGCQSTCTFTPLCGDGLVQFGEDCDDANLDNGDGCDSLCIVEDNFQCFGEPSSCIPDCGNGDVDTIEECDDGNLIDGDGCDSGCLVEYFVSNGSIEGPEECDDSNTSAGDGCSTFGQVETIIADAGGNDSLATAQPITLDSFVVGSITNSNDKKDFYSFTLDAPAVVRFEAFDSLTELDCLNADITLRLFSGTTQIATGGGFFRPCGSLVFPLDAGNFTIQIEETGTNNNVPNYRLEANILDDRGSESEVVNELGTNDTIETADRNLLNTPTVNGGDVVVSGDHSKINDVDFYAITVPAGKTVRAEIIEGDRAVETCEAGGISAKLSLFDQVGFQRFTATSAGTDRCSVIGETSHFSPNATKNTTGVDRIFYLEVKASSTTATNGSNQFTYKLAVTVR